MGKGAYGSTRRQFLGHSAVLAAIAMGGKVGVDAEQKSETQPAVPWYRRTYRWGQTNITEADIGRYDIGWWRQYWKRTATQGAVINAGGIFAYYPSKFPLHQRAQGLGDRDLYGELAAAAHDDGLVVLARMDSSKAHEEFYRAHPDWFTKDSRGRPYRSGDLYVACLNGPYYEQYLPDVFREIIERSHPQGFADNSWSGLDRGSICYCENCAKRFGEPLPKRHDWDDPPYRKWIEWSYQRRLEVWDFFNRVAREAGGVDCLWLGMNSGSVTGQSRSFRDVRKICGRSQIVMLDHQSRSDLGGFADNSITGKLIHGVLGWEKLIPESMPMYQAGRPTFRLSAKPAPEARMWMLAGFAGGIQPWWHHISAYHEDRRAYLTAEPVMRWHAQNQKYLVDRTPVASVGVVWSQRNTDYFGRDNSEELVDQPWRGVTQALVRGRIPFVPVHADDIAREAPKLAVLVLPNLGAMSDSQVAAVRKFVESGGGIVATGQTGLYDAWGDPRADFALADLFGVSGGKPNRTVENAARHTYMRMSVERRGKVGGPHVSGEPADEAPRHPALAGFDETDILPFGGTLGPLKVSPGATALLTFVPSFPAFPPETAWMRTPRTDIPGLIVNEPGPGRVAFVPADIDRRFAIDNLPDHGDLLANLVRWASKGNLPLEVRGHGLVDCELYRQPGRMILHMLNLTSAGTWRAPVDELIAIGPLQVRIRLMDDVRPRTIGMLVAGGSVDAKAEAGWALFQLASLLDHEVVVVE
ncbi:MAG TPA: hypothetical protein VK797_17550 [Tepidisphaeraceae bacterium]|nr:hypothetical protein [Tepidisphaeraceae bacterium]